MLRRRPHSRQMSEPCCWPGCQLSDLIMQITGTIRLHPTVDAQPTQRTLNSHHVYISEDIAATRGKKVASHNMQIILLQTGPCLQCTHTRRTANHQQKKFHGPILFLLRNMMCNMFTRLYNVVSGYHMTIYLTTDGFFHAYPKIFLHVLLTFFLNDPAAVMASLASSIVSDYQTR